MDLVTGATGFIGHRLAQHLLQQGRPCRLLSRQPQNREHFAVADLADPAALTAACTGVERIFHCAGHAHSFASFAEEDGLVHWRVNFEGTRNLLEAAGRTGVRCLVFLSSVKAMAETGAFLADEDYPGQPASAYGHSKRAAEAVVLETGARLGMHVVNLRLPLVYGAGGHGNMERMGRLVRCGLFPPLPETGNHRSMVHVNDVVSAICLVAGDKRAAGKTYIIGGQQAPSGRQLYDTMRKVLGLPGRGWAVPASLLHLAADCGDRLEAVLKRRLVFDSETLDRLLGSAWYSPGRIEEELGWRAEVSLEEGLREMFGR